jgi:hypothetical protein
MIIARNTTYHGKISMIIAQNTHYHGNFVLTSIPVFNIKFYLIQYININYSIGWIMSRTYVKNER